MQDEELDAARFERLREEGREALASGDAERASSRLGDALGLWRGAALHDFTYEPFAQAEIARLEELRLLAEEERIEAELALGRDAELVGELERLVSCTPLREHRRAQLMLALYRAGRQGDALAAYRKARETLVEELGVEPSPELRELERAILAQEDWLLGSGSPARPSETRETRRVVTVLFADPAEAGSADDPEVERSASALLGESVRAVLAPYGAGAEVLPDGTVMGVFGNPMAHEDDAVRAVHAAVELRERGLASRCGIETGEALATGTAVAGPVVSTAARLKELAPAGEIVVGDATRRLVQDLARLELVQAELVEGWRVVETLPSPPRSAPDPPLVGRIREVDVLREAFARSVAEGRAQFVAAVGEAGIGKSRLARELSDGVGDDGRVLEGRCLPYGEAITYWPFRDVIRQAGAQTPDEIGELLSDVAQGEAIAARIAGALGLADTLHRVEEIRWAMRRLFETLAQDRPLLLIFDDVHWAEPAFLDVLEHLVDTSQTPILVLCLAREDPFADRPGWTERENARVLALAPLTREESGALLAGLRRPRVVLDPAERARIVAAADGNPLFLEQLAAFAAERERILTPRISLPPTLRSLLVARLDRLGPGERTVLECAAVIGRAFSLEAIRALVPPEGTATLQRHLDSLIQRELLEPRRTALPFGRAFRFRHALIQEAAYHSLPKERRASAHERLADWLEDVPPGMVANKDKMIGYHLELAYGYRMELGGPDEASRQLAGRAARHLAAAAGRASARGNPVGAASLLDRACALLGEGDGRRLELLPRLGVELCAAGEHDRAEAVLVEAADEAVLASDERSELRARLELAALREDTAPRGEAATESRRIATQAIPVFEAAGDEASLARAWHRLGYLDVRALRWDAGRLALERALEHARAAGEAREETEVVRLLAASLLFGSLPAQEGIERCEDLLSQVAGQRDAEAGVLEALASLHAMRGRFDEARELHRRGARTYADLSEEARLTRLTAVGTRIELLAGDRKAAERELRSAYETYEARGENGSVAAVAASLARLASEVGRDDEAERLARVAERSARSDDLTTQVRLRAAQAKVLARQGRLDEAESLVREAVDLTSAAEFPDWQGDTFMDLADVLTAAERPDEAMDAAKEALSLYESKGNLVSADKARGALVPG